MLLQSLLFPSMLMEAVGIVKTARSSVKLIPDVVCPLLRD